MTRFHLTREWLEDALARTERVEKITLPAETARVLMRAALELLLIDAEEDDEDEVEPLIGVNGRPPETRH